MAAESLGRIVGEHALFRGLGQEFLDLVAGCARNVRFAEGTYLYHEGDSADEVFLIREGLVNMEISAPGQGTMVVQTMGPNALVGLSWIVPPYRWAYDARAATDLRAISLDATCLRGKCDADPALGYEVMKRIAPVIIDRLHATRLQMLDLYGEHG